MDQVIAAMEAQTTPPLTAAKSFYVEISRTRDRVEFVTDDAQALDNIGDTVRPERELGAKPSLERERPDREMAATSSPDEEIETPGPGTRRRSPSRPTGKAYRGDC